MDCGSNSCWYAESKGGMRTNGPCQCPQCPTCGGLRSYINRDVLHRDTCTTQRWKRGDIIVYDKIWTYNAPNEWCRGQWFMNLETCANVMLAWRINKNGYTELYYGNTPEHAIDDFFEGSEDLK